MEIAIGFGGIFFKADTPKALRQWYKNPWGFPLMKPMEDTPSTGKMTDSQKMIYDWDSFKCDTDYLNPNKKRVYVQLYSSGFT